MKRPRIRFSIGGLMLLVFVVGAVIGIGREIRARRTPSAAELRAYSSYQTAVLSRELAEIMIETNELTLSSIAQTERDLKPVVPAELWSEIPPGMPIVRWKGHVDPPRTPAPDPAPPKDSILGVYDWKASVEDSLNRHRGELARSRADEAASRAAYERERSARLGWLGRWVKP